MLAYPRLFKTTDELGKAVNSSGGMIRKWRRDPGFQAMVQEFELEFTRHVLASVSSEDFIATLYKSEYEPVAWSDNVLLLFSAEISNALGLLESKDSAEKEELISNLRGAMSHLNNFIPFEREVHFQNHPAAMGVYASMLHDLAGSAALAWQTKAGRGRKPYDTVRQRTADAVKGVMYESPITALANVLEVIEHELINNADRDEVLKFVRIAKNLVERELGSGSIKEEGNNS
jgi:hypothetical protein